MLGPNEFDSIDRYAMNLMVGALWLIPTEQNRHLISICLDLQERGYCSVKRLAGYDDGRVLCELTGAGQNALQASHSPHQTASGGSDLNPLATI
jgi:hypothetical protein